MSKIDAERLEAVQDLYLRRLGSIQKRKSKRNRRLATFRKIDGGASSARSSSTWLRGPRTRDIKADRNRKRNQDAAHDHVVSAGLLCRATRAKLSVRRNSSPYAFARLILNRPNLRR